MLEHARASAASRPPSSSRSPPSARPASELDSGDELECRALARRVDPGLRPRALLAPAARVSAEWAPQFVDGRRRRRRQHAASGAMHDDVPLVVSEVNPDALDGHHGLDRQPELLDDADDGRAEADPRRGRDRAPGRLHLPVGLRHRRSRRSRSCETQTRAVARTARTLPAPRSTRTRSPSTCCRRSRTSRTATTTPTRSAR